MGEKVQGIGSLNGRHKIDRGRVRTIEEIEKPKNLHVQPMDMNEGGQERWREGGCRAKENTGEKKNGTTVSIINKIHLPKKDSPPNFHWHLAPWPGCFP